MVKRAIFDKKNVLVTGGAGFIGAHLCRRLLEDSKVICVDNFLTGDVKNIEHFLANPDFVLIKADINQLPDLESLPDLQHFKIQFQGIQEIYNLACPMSPVDFEKNQMQNILVNSVGIKNVLDAAVKYQSAFVQFSSSVVYGPRRNDAGKVTENQTGSVDTVSARASYDEGKRFAETMVETYRQVYGIETKIARVFRTYCPRLKIRDAQPPLDFIINALEGKDLVIYGDARSSSMCYVTDIVDGLVRLMHHPEHIGPVNLGDDQDYSLEDIAQKIIDMTGSLSKIVHEPPLPFLSSLGLPSLRKAKDTLGWFPLVRLEDGLKRTIDYAVANKESLGLAV